MDQRSPSFEASLLYKTAPAPDLDELIEDFRAIVDSHGEELRHRQRLDEVFTLLTCDTVEILLAQSPDPLPVAHFLGADRPSVASLGDTEILMRLKSVGATGTILVVDRDTDTQSHGPDREAVKRDLCWEVTECLFHHANAELVFWADSDTLYAAEEFERACLHVQRQTEAPAVEADEICLPKTSARVPESSGDVPDSPGAEAAEPSAEHAGDSGKKSALATVLRMAKPARLAPGLGRLTRQLTRRRVVNCVAMTCSSATIGLIGLPNLSNVLM